MPWIGDLASRAGCDALLAHARSALGRVTHFVHSASPPRRENDHVLAVTTRPGQQMHAVNLDAGFHLARELARPADRGQRARLVPVLTSLHAGTPRNLPHYSTPKAALAMLVKELARTLRPLRHPRQRAGARRHRGRRLCRRSVAGKTYSARPARARRRSRADGAGGAVEQLSAYVTGAAFVVDGGLSLTNWFEPPELEDR